MKIATIIFALIISASVSSCTKSDLKSDTTLSTAARHGNGVEDNSNGGGGNNVSSVPAAVSTAFTNRYPDATAVQWKLLSNGNYKAEFYRGAVKWQATFTATGTLVKEEHE